jgi:hypothetical protein
MATSDLAASSRWKRLEPTASPLCLSTATSVAP